MHSVVDRVGSPDSVRKSSSGADQKQRPRFRLVPHLRTIATAGSGNQALPRRFIETALALRTMNRHLRFTKYLPLVVAVVTACGLASCATYSKVSERRPRFIPFTSGAGPLTNAETGIVKAMQIDRRDPLAALGEYMSAAETALRQLERSPQDETARHTYNFTVGRIIATIRDAKLDPWTEPLRVPASDGEFVLTHKPDPRPQWNPALYDFTPADQFDVHGTYVTERTTRDGIGAPVVAVGREANKEAHANFSLSRIYYGVTAIARFDGRRCVLSFEDPLAVETVRMDGQIFPLAADFTVLTQQRGYPRADKPLRVSNQHDPDHARHPVSYDHGRPGQRRRSEFLRWCRAVLEFAHGRREVRAYRFLGSRRTPEPQGH